MFSHEILDGFPCICQILCLKFISQFKTKGGSQLKEYCSNLTKEDCRRQSGSFVACDKVSGGLSFTGAVC